MKLGLVETVFGTILAALLFVMPYLVGAYLSQALSSLRETLAGVF
jgi:hypothetical protein